jgi:hypothetical protein
MVWLVHVIFSYGNEEIRREVGKQYQNRAGPRRLD